MTIWTDKKLDYVKYLTKCNTSSEIGKVFGTTKNAILGALYRDKIKNGYVPPPDSKYAIKKPNYPTRRYWLSVYPMLMG